MTNIKNTNSVQVHIKHSALMELKQQLEASQADVIRLGTAAQVNMAPSQAPCTNISCAAASSCSAHTKTEYLC